MEMQRGFDRLVNLSDAVVAIAATLLVLPLVDIAGEISERGLGELLAENSNQLLAFVISFAVICRFWLVHHSVFNRLVGFNGPLIWLNFLWLFTIVFLPFPTELVSFTGQDDSGSSALYVGTMLVTSIATCGQQWVVIRTPSLQAAGGQPLSLLPSAVTVVTMLVVLAAVIVLPSVGLWAMLLLLPAGWTPGIVARVRGRRAGIS
jgi:uncharacterized membrane protein